MGIEKLVLLGHSEAGIGLMMDLVSEMVGVRVFDVVKNLDLPDCLFSPNLYKINFFKDTEYDFLSNEQVPVQFGVQKSEIRFSVFNHFRNVATIGENRFLSIIHRSSYVAPSSEIEKGVLIEPQAVLSSYSKVGFGVSLKRSASVGHHADLGDFVSINPGAVLSGYVKVGMGTEIGSGAVISNNVTIGKKSLIGAGSVVTRDIPDGVIAFGNPCKVVRENERWAHIALDK